MNNSTAVLIIVLVIIVGFFFMNNVVHVGFHIGHGHDEYEEFMMMNGHEDEIASYEISPGVVTDKIASGEDIVLLDVRTPEEYAEVHLENSILVPVGELSQKTLAEAGLGEHSKDREIIIYCRSGGRSKQAYDIMNSLGYTNIKSVAGGIIHWQEDNYPYLKSGEYGGDVQSTDEQSSTGGPRIVFDRSTHDFGESPQSAGILSTTFEVKNTGDKILTIGDLSTSCGCTTAKLSQSSINPDGSATLTVYFDPDFHDEPSGKLTRTVFIPTNDPNQPEAEVKITVDILEGK